MLFVRSIRTDTWALVRSWIAKLSYVNAESPEGVVFHQGRSHTSVNCVTKALPRSASWCSTAGCTTERRSLTNVMSATCSLQPRATWRSTPGRHKWDPANAYPWVYLNRNIYSSVRVNMISSPSLVGFLSRYLTEKLYGWTCSLRMRFVLDECAAWVWCLCFKLLVAPERREFCGRKQEKFSLPSAICMGLLAILAGAGMTFPC